jgi:apolipoprotein N-acyltransferase
MPFLFYICAIFAGLFGVLALPPFGFFPAMFAALSALYILLTKTKTPVQAFITGWVFGFGYFAAGLFWVGNALLVEGNDYAWAWPLAVCGLPFILSFFPAFACFFARKFFDLKTVAGLIAFVVISGFYEWARGVAFTGFPWNLYGHAWAGVLPMLQILSVSNVYWLTLATIFWGAVPGFVLSAAAPRRIKIILCGVTLFTILGNYAFGLWRLNLPMPPSQNVDIHVVQANIAQSEKWDGKKAWQHLEKRIAMSDSLREKADKPLLIVWPETAMSQWVFDRPEARAMITAMLQNQKSNAYLLTGLLRRRADTDEFFNSVVMVDAGGNVTNTYDKNHLVPFGEYIPFQEWIPLRPVAQFKGFSGGGKAQTFETPEGLKYSPVICYEIIFSGAVVDQKNRPDFILNVTNDSWYGKTPGPYQHKSQAVFRAIEEGLPVVRVADTGITTIIDPMGRVVFESPLFEEFSKTVPLPGRI